MRLRKLELKDAPFMIEWMHDKNVTNYLRANFASKQIYDAEAFIKSSWEMDNNVHMAITSDEDEYMGTVSLKNIKNNTAEFAIAIRTVAMGCGYAWFGIKAILEKAFSELNLENVYWCVSKDNIRALRFYDKHKFNEMLDIPEALLKEYESEKNLKWYSVSRGEDINIRESIVGCKVIKIKAIPTIDSGELSVLEGLKDIPFEIKRLYYITKVPEGVRRGFHAHKNLKQFLFCPYGRIQLTLENELGREEIELSDPSVGVLIERCTWREMVWLQTGSVLCVAASEYYDAEDYIRDYRTFHSYIGINKK